MSYSPSSSFTFSASSPDYTPSAAFIFSEGNSLSSDGYYGSVSSNTLKTHTILNSNSYYGEESDNTLSLYAYFASNSYYGEESVNTVSSSLNVQFIFIDALPHQYRSDFVFGSGLLDPVYGYYGNTSTCNLSLSQYNISYSYYGNESTYNLSCYPVFSVEIYYGNLSTNDLTLVAAPILNPQDNYYGDSSYYDLSLNVRFNTNGYYGEDTSYNLSIFPAIDLGNTFNYYGESAESNLSIYFNLDNTCYYGSECNSTLYVPPTAYLENNAYYGQFSNYNLRLSYNIFFDAHCYYGDESYNVWSDQKFTIDLDLDSCCFNGGHRPSVNESWNIELDNAEWYDQTYQNKSRIKVSHTLSTGQRFHCHAHYGNTAQIVDTTVYLGNVLTGSVYTAQYGYDCTFEFEANNKHRLCKGNFIPDSENVIVELTEIVSENCESTFSYYGRTLTSHLSVNNRFVENVQYGEFLRGEGLSIYPAIIPPPSVYAAYYGVGLNYNLSVQYALSGEAQYGSVLTGPIYKEVEYKGYYGYFSTCTLVELVGVEITDSGDLENEYLYLTKDGDPIPEKFTRSVVELYPYQHWIKARCIKL